MSGPRLAIADCHNDLLMSVLAQRQAGVEDPFGDFWLGQLRTGGVTVQVLPIFTDDVFAQEAALRHCLLMIDEAYRLAERYGDEVAIVGTSDELAEAQRTGRIALVLAIEGAEPVGRDLAVLRTLHRVGVRMLSLTWNRRTALADGVGEEDTGGRLTSIGRQMVGEMEQLGMLLDVSHLSRNGFWDAVELVQRPFIASHSSADAVHAHPRNLTDEQLAAMRAHGALVCANAYGRFVGAPYTIDHFVEHIAHLSAMLGTELVGLGNDFILDVYEVTDAASGRGRLPNHGDDFLEGFVRPADLPSLADALLARFGEAAAAIAHDNLAGFLSRHLA